MFTAAWNQIWKDCISTTPAPCRLGVETGVCHPSSQKVEVIDSGVQHQTHLCNDMGIT